MGFGDAAVLATTYLKSLEESKPLQDGDPIKAAVEEIYSDTKAVLRPLHDLVMGLISSFGEFEIAPKKGYLSLRRKRQFAMLGPASKGRLEVGLNMKGVESGERLLVMPPGGMCQYKVYLTDPAEVDAELGAWIKQAYDNAG
jgi:hypothetical protein